MNNSMICVYVENITKYGFFLLAQKSNETNVKVN